MEFIFGGLFIGLFFGGLFFGIMTAVIATNRNRSGFAWFVLGFLFGPIGTILALIASYPYRCPYCNEGVQELATICPHCRTKLAVAEKPPKW